MEEITRTILAIVPGARETGFAVFHNKTLFHYGVTSTRKRISAQNVSRAVNRFCTNAIEKFCPDVLAIEKRVSAERFSALVRAATNQLRVAGEKHKLLICEYEQKDVRKTLCRTGKPSKRNVIGIIARHYPEIARFLKLNSRWERQYYANLLESIALGMVCAQKFIRQQKDLG